METYCIVKYEHGRGEPPSPFLIPEEHLTNITNISNFRVAKTELPDDEGSMVQNE
jgi:hypothetical protein